MQSAIAKLTADGAGSASVAAFRRRLEQLADPGAGMLPGGELEPVDDVVALEDLDRGAQDELDTALDRLVVLKLNGGLGTSMGLHGPKSLIEVKPGHSFLDVVAAQVRARRKRHAARLPLVLMSSFSTRRATLQALAERHPDIAADVPLDFLQGREPKLLAETLEPASWPADPDLEWCPPGHGDLYVSLAASGMLATLREAGYEWAFVSNSDNLGADGEDAAADEVAATLAAHGADGVVHGRRRGEQAANCATARDARPITRQTRVDSATSASRDEGDECMPRPPPYRRQTGHSRHIAMTRPCDSASDALVSVFGTQRSGGSVACRSPVAIGAPGERPRQPFGRRPAAQ